MAERPESSIQRQTPEQQQKPVRAHLVTGNHLSDEGDIRTMNNRLDSGDLRANMWQATDVSKQLKSSFPQPTLLVVDGMQPVHPNKADERDYDFVQKKDVWRKLPGRPSEINSSGQIVIVAGDIISQAYQEVLQPFYTKNATSPEGQKDALAVINQNRPSLDSVASTTLPDIYTALPAGLAVFTAMVAAVNYGDKVLERKAPARDARTFSRRKLLEFGVVAGGSATIALLMNKYGQRTVPKEIGDNVLDTIARAARRESSSMASVDGRTALMIEKGLAAAARLDEAEATVVAGDAHSHNKESLLAKPEARAQAVSDYAKILIKITDEASDKAGFSNDLRLTARGILLDNMLYGQILRATDPGYAQVAPNELERVLDTSIHFDSDFMIGSGAVSDAIESLRQGAPKVYGPFGMNIHPTDATSRTPGNLLF